MIKYLPLISVGATGKLDSIMQTGKQVGLTTIPVINANYILTYDKDRGILYAVQPDGTLLEASGFNTISSIGVGETGFAGNDGTDGQSGANGTDGAVGKVGMRGSPGSQGPQGERGIIGDRGEKGARGDVGLQGNRGPIGQIGRKGAKGSKGERGFRGIDHDLYVVFSENEPEHPVKPGNVWNQIITHTYSGMQQKSCGSNSSYISSFLTGSGVIGTKELTTKDIKPIESWKILTLLPKNGLDVKTYLTQILSEEGSAKSLSFVDSFSGQTFASEQCNRIWKASFSTQKIGWTQYDPLIKRIVIDKHTLKYTIVDDDYVGDTSYIFYDRGGNCPGITMENLCLI